MAHSYHPDIHTHGLADDCPDCARAAAHPTRWLDDQNLGALVERALGRRREPDNQCYWSRTVNEHTAMRNVMAIIEAAERIVGAGDGRGGGVVWPGVAVDTEKMRVTDCSWADDVMGMRYPSADDVEAERTRGS